VLRCWVARPMRPPVPAEIVALWVGLSIAGLTGIGLYSFEIDQVIIVASTGAIVLLSFVLSFRVWRREQSYVALFDDRLVLQHRDRNHLTIRVDLAEVTCVSKQERRRINIMRRGHRPLSFRVHQLVAEDAFDSLVDRVTRLNPDCDVTELD
jgi:hypothetical protein